MCGVRYTLKQDAGNVQEMSQYDEDHWVRAGGVLKIACASPSHDLRMGNSYAWRDRGHRGRYVTIKVKGTRKILHLCEVQIMGGLQSSPSEDQGYQAGSYLETLAQGGGLPVDPCAPDLLLQTSSIARLCHE